MSALLHKCEAESCDRKIASDKFMCITHWRMVPKALQREIWRAWRTYNAILRKGRASMDDVKQLRSAQAPAIAAVREKEINRQIKKDARGDVLNFE